jgi:uncharacterized protein VirK/YbjX
VINTVKTLVRTAPLIHPGHRLGSFYKQAKHCVRGLAFARLSDDWFEILQSPALAVVAGNHPYLFQKLQRPYLNRTLNTGQRFQVLRQHYQFVVSQFSPVLRREIYATPGKLLAVLPLAEAGNFGLRLSCSRQEKEGDLMIGLVNLNTGMVLFTLAFSVTQFETRPREIFIGGLQGNKLANDRELVVAITRECYGLRPKALLLFVLQTLAGIWGVSRLRAVSDAMHIYRHWQKRKQVAASYDEWWLESGGRLAADGMFDLPATFVPRDIASLKVNKRQLYRRRYLMLAEIAAQISSSASQVAPLPSSPPNPVKAVPSVGHGGSRRSSEAFMNCAL